VKGEFSIKIHISYLPGTVPQKGNGYRLTNLPFRINIHMLLFRKRLHSISEIVSPPAESVSTKIDIVKYVDTILFPQPGISIHEDLK